MSPAQIDNALDRAANNMLSLAVALQRAESEIFILGDPDMTLHKFLDSCARNNISLNARYEGDRNDTT